MLPAKIYEIFHIAIKKERKVKKRLKRVGGKKKKHNFNLNQHSI
ncbi:hypothetical protein BOVAC1_5237 [Bacteroides ovatus]|jgi:hypothetical protein|nr:hypothetical protein BOVAC1_5237 [Bacteroides ovatus]CAG9878416.1 hypothetical protein BOVA115_2443 [Bacteroides ovatus]